MADTGAPDDRPVAFVHLGYGLDAARYRERFLAGEEPDETPYGFHVAERLGFHVQFSHDHPENSPRRFIRRAAKRLLGFDAIHLWRNRYAIAGADVVWTMQESEWLALRFVALFDRAVRRPVIGNTVWLFDRWERVNPLLRRLYARLARGAGVLTVHSDRYLPLVRRALPHTRIERMFFGTSMEAHPLRAPTIRATGPATPVRILAAGNDPTRDWGTLLEAIGNDPRFTVELVCAWLPAHVRARYSSVLPRPMSSVHRLAEFQRLYRWADIVVVTMHENLFSGITVALEATANGKPLVASRTGGVPTYFDEDMVRFVPPRDVAALRAAVMMPAEEAERRVLAAQRAFRERDYSLTGLMGRYIALSRPLIEARRSSPAVRQG